jgi:hypothetical protein
MKHVNEPVGALGNYIQSIFSLLDRVEYRRISSASDFADIERLRRSSYESKMLIDPKSFGSLLDDDDLADDCYVIGVYVDEQMVSTIRLHIIATQREHGPSWQVFPDATRKLLENGTCMVDPSRFATDPTSLWKYPAIPLLTLRAAAMALEYFSATHLVGVVRDDAASFYKRCFGGEAVSKPVDVPGVMVPVLMLACPVSDIRDKIETRYPFFKSQAYERKMMFAPRDQLNYPSLNILPSAKYAHMASANLAVATNPEVMSA